MKTMRQFFVLFVSILLFGCSSSKNAIVQSESYLEIEFQDGFSEDTVSVKVGDCPIFSKKVLTSSRNMGTTEVNIFLYKSEGKLYFKYGEEIIRCRTEETAPAFIVTVNSRQNVLQFDEKKGKYIGLNLEGQDQLDILQLNKPFRHE